MSTVKKWSEFPRNEYCPICGHLGRCKVSPDSQMVLCFREKEGCMRPARNDVGWLHRMTKDPNEPPTHAVGTRTVSVAEGRASEGPPCASREILHRAYTIILARLSLYTRHREALRKRGLSDDAIDVAEYRTLPEYNRIRWALARQVVDQLGESALGVPGLAERRSRNGGSYFTLGGRPGLLIPVRDVDGTIGGMLVRPDDPGDGGKYQWLHIAGSPHNTAQVHVPRRTESRGTVVLTEGALKADVVRHLSPRMRVDSPRPWCVLGLPGVSAGQRALPLLRALYTEQVLLAFDADLVHNAAVALALRSLVTLLCEEGFTVGILTWNPAAGKGLDDVLIQDPIPRLRLNSVDPEKEVCDDLH